MPYHPDSSVADPVSGAIHPVPRVSCPAPNEVCTVAQRHLPRFPAPSRRAGSQRHPIGQAKEMTP